MSTFLWGNLPLKVEIGSYTLPLAEVNYNELDILKNPSDLFSPATIIQQNGRKRKKISFSVVSETTTEYQKMLDDMIQGVQNFLQDPLGNAIVCIIQSITSPTLEWEPRLGRGVFRFNVELLEA